MTKDELEVLLGQIVTAAKFEASQAATIEMQHNDLIMLRIRMEHLEKRDGELSVANYRLEEFQKEASEHLTKQREMLKEWNAKADKCGRRTDELMVDYITRLSSELAAMTAERDKLATLQAPMTPAVPTKPGYYWWRDDESDKWDVRFIQYDVTDHDLFVAGSTHKLERGQYVGPIEPPKVQA